MLTIYFDFTFTRGFPRPIDAVETISSRRPGSAALEAARRRPERRLRGSDGEKRNRSAGYRGDAFKHLGDDEDMYPWVCFVQHRTIATIA